MGDRTSWDDWREERDREDWRRSQQGGWNERGRQEGRQSEWNQTGSARGNRHGADFGPAHDWGESRFQQPYQREWRGTERPWGGSSQQGGGHGERHATDRYAEARFGGESFRSGERRGDWRGDWRTPESQSFATGYGMPSGPVYDERSGYDRSGSQASGSSNPNFGRGYGSDYGRQESRGFMERAGDEIASRFGEDDGARRGQQDYRGHGPSDYTRSDERIREDANDRLTDDPWIDARRVSVGVENGEVTLTGTVPSREAKRRAEDCIDRISGVRHVQNNLRIEQRDWRSGSGAGPTSSSQGTAPGARGSGAVTGARKT